MCQKAAWNNDKDSHQELTLPERAVRKTNPPVPLANLLSCRRRVVSASWLGKEINYRCCCSYLILLNRSSWHVGRRAGMYLVRRPQHREPCPEAGTVEQQRRAKMSTQAILTDPRDVV